MANGRYTLLIDTKVGSRAGLEQLKKDLLNVEALAKGQSVKLGLTPELEQATTAARQLRDVLDSSWNSKLQQLDLSKLSKELQHNQLSLKDIKASFESIGAVGATAYNKLARTVLGTNVQIKQSNKFLTDMFTTMKNTAKWGVSSSLFNSLTGQLQKAYGFVQDLDRSLNDIRIVTSKTNAEMADFAKNANNAAKALGASTVEYTDASLIYYQQGLNDKEVMERTNTTMKMANVLGTNAQEVSEYMTAIWNNYDDGSKSLEYYADVITKLGAATASSAEEISAGLEKFAAVSDTIGLSYEYATAALTTVTATTRQSADVVGTAFKTLFSRIQGLKLGETLDDGTTLNKYSSALEAVGVNIKDSTGALKDMDVILDEMGDKWGTLARDQKVALAQTVAGVRQYNQLMSLMDNWDFFKENLNTANNATGALNEQQEIYMDSLEAHLEKMSAEWESLYDTIFDEETVKTLVDLVTGLTGALNNLMQGLGGGMNDIVFIVSSLSSIFSKQLGGEIENVLENIEKAKNNAEGLTLGSMIIENGEAQSRNPNKPMTEYDDANRVILEEQIGIYSRIQNIRNQIGDEQANDLLRQENEIAHLKEMLTNYEHYEELVERTGILQDKELDVTELTNEHLQEYLKLNKEKLEEEKENLDTFEEWINSYQRAMTNKDTSPEEKQAATADINSVWESKNFGTTEYEDIVALAEIEKKVRDGQLLTERDIKFLLSEQTTEVQRIQTIIDQTEQAKKAGLLTDIQKRDEAKQELDDREKALKKTLEEQERAKQISATISIISNTISTITAMSGLFKLWSDEDVSAGEKIAQTLTVMAALVPVVMSLGKSMKELGVAMNIINIQNGTMMLTSTGAKTGMLGLAKGLMTAQVSAWGLQLSLWQITFIAAAVAAVIALVCVGVKAMSDAYNADAIAAEKAAAAAKEVAEANEEVQQSLKDLKSSFDAYETATEKLEKCTKGTEEWKAALDEANEAAITLLDNLPSNLSASEIKSLYTRDSETGRLTIDTEKTQGIIQKQEQVASASQYAVAASSNRATLTQVEAEMIDQTRKMSKEMLTMADVAGMATYGLTGLAEANELEAQIIQDKLIENIDEFSSDLTMDEFKKKLQSLGVNIYSFSNDELETYKNKIAELSDTTAAANEKLRMIAEIQVGNAIGDEYDGAETKLTAEQVTGKEKDIYNKIISDNNEQLSKASNAGDDYYQELADRLNKATSGQYSAATGNTVLGTDTNRRFIFADENGEETEEKSLEWVASTIAAYEALQQAGSTAEEIATAFNNLEDSVGEDLATGIKDYVTSGNLESLTEEEYKQLAEMGPQELADAFGVSILELNKVLGEEGLEGLKEAKNNYATAFEDFSKNLSLEAQRSFEEISDTDKLSVSGQKAIAETLDNALYYGSQESADTISKTFDKLNGTNIEGFTNVFKGVDDWSNISVNDLVGKLNEAGVNTDLTTEELELFINAMRDTSDATADSSEALRKAYKEIQSIVSDLERGDTIEEEDYNKLSTSAQEYFTLMMDGTYKLTANAERLNELIQKEQLDKFNSKKQGLVDKTDNLARIQGYDFEKLSQNATTTKADGSQSFNRGTVEQQLDILKQLGGDKDLYNKIANDLNDGTGTMSSENLTQLANAVKELKSSYEGLDGEIAKANTEIYALEQSIAFSFTTYDELRKALDEGTVGVTAFNEAYNEMYAKERTEDIDLEEMNEYADYIKEIAKNSKDFDKSLADNEEACEDVATQIMRMDDGLENLAENWEDWGSILKKSSKSSEEYAEAMRGVKEAVADLLDLDEEYISDNFVEKHLKDIEAAAKGDTDAIERLRAVALEEVILNIDFRGEDKEALKTEFTNILTNLQSIADAQKLSVGADMDLSQLEQGEQEYIDMLNNMLMAGQITEADVNSALSAINYSPVYTEESYPVESQIPQTTTHHRIANFKMVSIGKDGLQGPTWDDVTTVETKMVPVTGEHGVGAIGTTENPPKVTTRKLSTVKKKANSTYSNYSSRNAGGPALGGKGGSKKEAKKEDPLEKEIDVYHDINIAIKQVETSLGRLQKQQEKLFGGDLVDNLNQQLAELNKQIDNYRTKIGIATGEQQRMQRELANKGVAFNADGTIANYAAAYEAQFNYVNSIIKKYNNMSADAQEDYKDTVDKAKEDFDKFVESMEEYDDLVTDMIPGLQDEIQAMIDEQIELQIQKFNMEIEIRLDLEEAQREWNDFKKRIIDGIDEDDILGNVKEDVKNYGIYYDKQGTGIIQKEAEHLYEILDQLKQMDETGTSSYYGDNRAQALEDLKTYTDAIMSSMEELDELIKQIEESYVNLMDEAQEKFDEQIENFEFITENLEHNIQLVELMKGTEQFADVDTFELMNSYYEKQQENYQQQIQFQASQVAFWKEQMDGAEYASDEWESAREKWMAATSELNSLIEASIENLQTKYLNAIDSIFDKMNKSVTNGLGLDYISEEWDLINKNADQYLDTINRAYGIQKLQDKYLDAIDGTDSISAQQKLNKLMEQELNALKNKDKLTEYDLERAEKKYEIALKQIALEEAQQNKSQLRLRRDSQGNYRYEYVADDDEVSKLKQEIDSLYNALYNFDLDRYKENLEQAYDAWEEMQSKIYDIYQDTTLSEEQRNQKIALLQEQYGELINSIVAENEVIKLNLQESTYIELNRMYGENISHFEEMTLAQQELVNMLAGDSVAAYQTMSQEQQAIIAELCGFTLAEFTALSEEEQRIYLDLIQGYQNLADSEKDILEGQIVPQWTSGVQNMVDTIAGEGGLFPTCKDAFEQMDKAVEDLSKEMGTVLDDAEKDLTDLTTAQDDTILTTQNMITAMGDLTTAYGNQLAECKKVIDGLHDLQKEYREAEKAAKDMAIAANAYRTQEQKKAANETTVNSPSGNNTPAPAPAPQHRGPQGNGNPDVGDTVTYTGGYYYTSSNGGIKGKRGIGKQVRITQIANGARYPIHVYSTDSAYGWLKKEQLSGYDTGGYTGEWDNSGRLALLHQKELVLNATDTQNMLAAVEIIRSITDTIGSGMLNRLASLNASAVGFNANNAETIEQNVHIEASFPNVKDSREIEDALNNLVNTASQRVHTK